MNVALLLLLLIFCRCCAGNINAVAFKAERQWKQIVLVIKVDEEMRELWSKNITYVCCMIHHIHIDLVIKLFP